MNFKRPLVLNRDTMVSLGGLEFLGLGLISSSFAGAQNEFDDKLQPLKLLQMQHLLALNHCQTSLAGLS